MKRKMETGNGKFPQLGGDVLGQVMPIHQGRLKARALGPKSLRTKLSICKNQDGILSALREKNILVMFGETGSEKSTRIGQFFARGGGWHGRGFLSLLEKGMGMERIKKSGIAVASIIRVRGGAQINLLRTGSCCLRFRTIPC